MSIQLFKSWLVECQKKDPIFFEAATAAFDVMFESTEDVLKIAEQNLGSDGEGEDLGLEDDMGLGDIDSILDQGDPEFDDESEQSNANPDNDDDFQKLLNGIDSDDDDGNNLEIPDLDSLPGLN